MKDYSSRYDRIRRRKRRKTLRIMFFPLFLGVFISFFIPRIELSKAEIVSPVVKEQSNDQRKASKIALEASESAKMIEVSPTPETLVKSNSSESYEATSSAEFSSGYVSHYSRAGCLGCDPNMIMANGEPLDDTAMTIAVPPRTLPMGTKVKLTNTDNGKEVIAEVTDTGGFAKYNRIADLTIAVGNALETKTDQSIVKIEVLQ